MSPNIRLVADPFLAETKALLERTPLVLRDLLADLPNRGSKVGTLLKAGSRATSSDI